MGMALPMLPAMTQDSILHMRVSEDVKTLLDDLRKLEPDLPSRSEMVRRLIERAFAERKGKRK
jgi:metal-responsive CopG/Arc/MetJ family transcriptional regulator